MSKYFALRGYGGEHLDATPILLVGLNTETCAKMLARVGHAKSMREKDDCFSGMDFHDYTGEWFDLYSLDPDLEGVEDFQEVIDRDNVVVVDGDLLAHVKAKCVDSQYDGGAYIRTECNIMAVSHEGVRFKAYPKHTDLHMETSMLYVDLLEQSKSDGA